MTSMGLLDSTLASFNGAIAAAYPTLMMYAKLVWLALIVLQMGWIMFEGVRSGYERLVWHMCAGILGAGVSFAILTHALEWGGDVVGAGEQIAIAAGGVSPTAVTPSGIIDQGFAIVQAIWSQVGLGTWLLHTSDAAALWIAGFITGVAFFFAGLIYFFTTLFTTFLVAWGCLVLGFSAVEWTWPILFAWVNRVLALTVKLAVILLIIGAGMGLVNAWAGSINAGISGGRGVIWNFWALMITFVSTLWLSIIYYLPRYLSEVVSTSMLTHGGSSGESLLGTAMGAASGAAMGAASGGASELGETATALAAKVRSTLTT